jgi:HPr kinase/phosphorylase
MTPPRPLNLHASCVVIDGSGVLLLGESGSGKSDLALRLIDGGAQLLADDRVDVQCREGRLAASPPATIEGLLEIRGVGLLRLPFVAQAPLALAVELSKTPLNERLPERKFFDCLGVQLPLLSLHANDISTPAKIRACLRYALLP